MEGFFINKEHEEAFRKFLDKANLSEFKDADKISCLYILSLSAETRSFIERLYNFKLNIIEPSGLSYPWQTTSSRVLTILAFDLYNGFTTDFLGQNSVVGILKYVDFNIIHYIFIAMQIKFCRLVV